MSDALAEMAARALATGPVPIVRGEHTEVVLHIDADYLAGQATEGLCHLTNMRGIDLAGAQTLACDAKLRAMVRGADGTHVDLGRSQRLVSDKQRRLLNARDHGCRFPGCTNGRYVDAHHVHFWEDGGETNLANLVSLCHRHHRLLHQGEFSITADGHQHFTFQNRWNEPIGGRRNRPPGAPPGPCPEPPGPAVAATPSTASTSPSAPSRDEIRRVAARSTRCRAARRSRPRATRCPGRWPAPGPAA